MLPKFPDKMDSVGAYNDYEKWAKEAEEKDYKKGWVWHQMKKKYGEDIASRVCFDYEDEPGDETWMDNAGNNN